MNHRLIAILGSLRDIEGVLGSFISLTGGQLLASDMPENCSPATLEAVAARVQRLCDAFVSMGQQFESTTLAFAHYRLHICATESAFIGAVLAKQVNMSALKMAATLALRDLSTELSHPHPAQAAHAAHTWTLASTPQEEPPAPAGARSYRGQRLPS
jgi:predicted regulator of Ras-like GTPase activity (Roadblock/LC7/MglB family)